MNTNNCSICLNEIDIQITTLPCNHIYHTECIEAWVEINNTCPYCRYQLPLNIYLFDEHEEEIEPDNENEIESDDGIDDLDETTYNHYYNFQEGFFTQSHILENIENIKKAKALKDSLLFNRMYKITGNGIHIFGSINKIYKIPYTGLLCCKFYTDDNFVFYFFTELHQLELVE